MSTRTALGSKSQKLHFKAPNFLGAEDMNNSRATVGLGKGFMEFGVGGGFFRGGGWVQKLEMLR